tara:strand:- start:13 stop:579 length:567 start_codon:yes stop_codon:yes gene_type:complete
LQYCIKCGSANIEFLIPKGDNKPRFVCSDCDFVFYQNPKIVAGCIIESKEKILLCKRAIDPQLGKWTLPAGFMENNETIEQAALRESWEEACAAVEKLSLFAVYSLPHISQVYVMFKGQLKGDEAKPGEETEEIWFCSEAEIPWDHLAFPVITETLEIYFSDRGNKKFSVHSGAINRDSDGKFIVSRY